MEYLITFVSGLVVGAMLALAHGARWMKMAAIKQLRKDLNLPESPPLGQDVCVNPHSMAESYKKAVAERGKYGSMWGPKERNED